MRVEYNEWYQNFSARMNQNYFQELSSCLTEKTLCLHYQDKSINALNNNNNNNNNNKLQLGCHPVALFILHVKYK
jgi:hypothetical protein